VQTLSVGELKTRFSEVIGQLKKGKEIVISYGKKKEKIAVLIPYSHYKNKSKRQLGLLKDVGQCVIHKDFKMGDEEIMQS
jgi:antitoxin (DNA-binding transcriptional repressor) of toxin-antitoxin stability system